MQNSHQSGDPRILHEEEEEKEALEWEKLGANTNL